MQITRGYKTELDLNNQQITACKKHAGVARFAYNWGLKRNQEVYLQTGRSISAMELHRELNARKQTDLPWMYECSKAAPQEALRDLDRAFSHFLRRCRLKKEVRWRGKAGYPQLKTKRKGLGGFRLTGAINVYEQAIDLPRLGRLRLKECGYLPTSGMHILFATVSEEAGHWFVSLQVEEEALDPIAATGNPIGVDVGIKTLAQCSDGMGLRIPRRCAANSNVSNACIVVFLARERAARTAPRPASAWPASTPASLTSAVTHSTRAQVVSPVRVSPSKSVPPVLLRLLPPCQNRKPRSNQGRANVLKQDRRTQAPPLPEKVAKQVKQKQVKRHLRLPTQADAALRPRVVVLEDLNVEGMRRNRTLALSISDVGMGEFRRQMEYKTSWQGERFLLANRWYPSTKRCSACSNVKEDMDLSERAYVCEKPECGLILDRDLNAARSLVELALEPRQPTASWAGRNTPVERGALAGASVTNQ